jgi:hypothetical protein
MPLTGEPKLVEFDVEEALARARKTCVSDVQSFMEFTHNEYNIVYVNDEILAMYRDEEHLRDHYGRVVDHLHMDFLERDTIESTLLPNAGRVTSLITHTEELTLLRIFDDEAGVYIALDPDCSVEAIIEGIEPVI